MYISLEELKRIFGDENITSLLDRDNDGSIDLSTFEDVAVQASEEIDSYLASRYQVPLSYVPSNIKTLCGDIIYYRLHSNVVDDLTKERYEKATSDLTKMSKGVIKLNFEDDQGLAGYSSNKILFNADKRRV